MAEYPVKSAVSGRTLELTDNDVLHYYRVFGLPCEAGEVQKGSATLPQTIHRGKQNQVITIHRLPT